MALVAAAGVAATPRGRIPLALRGIAKVLGRGATLVPEPERVPAWRKALAFALTILAAVVAVI